MHSGTALPTVDLMGLQVAAVSTGALVQHVFARLESGQGGWIVTANLDFLRKYHRDPEVKSLYDAADLRVADGMPLVWASQLQGEGLPERVAGSSLTDALVAEAARRGRSLYLLGGVDGAARAAAEVWTARHPQLRVVGWDEPWVSNPPTAAELEGIDRQVERSAPDLLLGGFGTPKQEWVLRHLRRRFPSMWSVGIGGTFNFVSGRIGRAPEWMQQWGLEWVHRLAQEPRRLARRYLVEDLPFSAELLGFAARRRFRRFSG